MKVHRSVLLASTIASAAVPSCAAPPAEPEATSSAVDRTPELLDRIDALRDQQVRATDELRGMKAEVAELAALVRDRIEPVATEPAPFNDPLESAAAGPVVAEPDLAEGTAPAADGTAPADATADPAASDSPAQPFVDVARRLIADADYATALRVLEVAEELDPALDVLFFHRGVAHHLLQGYGEALDDFQAAIQRTERQDLRFICLFNQACGLARMGRKDEALDKLRASDEAGFQKLLEQITTDPDLDSLRDDPRFKEFVLMLRTR